MTALLVLTAAAASGATSIVAQRQESDLPSLAAREGTNQLAGATLLVHPLALIYRR